MRGNRTYLVRCGDCGTTMADRKLTAHQRKKAQPAEPKK